MARHACARHARSQRAHRCARRAPPRPHLLAFVRFSRAMLPNCSPLVRFVESITDWAMTRLPRYRTRSVREQCRARVQPGLRADVLEALKLLHGNGTPVSAHLRVQASRRHPCRTASPQQQCEHHPCRRRHPTPGPACLQRQRSTAPRAQPQQRFRKVAFPIHNEGGHRLGRSMLEALALANRVFKVTLREPSITVGVHDVVEDSPRRLRRNPCVSPSGMKQMSKESGLWKHPGRALRFSTHSRL